GANWRHLAPRKKWRQVAPMIEHFRTTFGAIWRHFYVAPNGAKWRQ
ncbi:MAG: hypothetical protein GY782_12190, partial [Gammaproteobacteria bacterium]|nr:hypothetical protein [Gammaproteobacteria bacterium]